MAKGKGSKINYGQIIFAAIAVIVIITMVLGAIYNY
jgi:hypothetical protein